MDVTRVVIAGAANFGDFVQVDALIVYFLSGVILGCLIALVALLIRRRANHKTREGKQR